MKLIKVKSKIVKRKDEVDEQKKKEFARKALSLSERDANLGNGFCGYEFKASEWNDKNYVEVLLRMPSASGDGSDEGDSVDTAIRVTENRLKTLKEVKQKLKKLQDEAKNLGLKI